MLLWLILMQAAWHERAGSPDNPATGRTVAGLVRGGGRLSWVLSVAAVVFVVEVAWLIYQRLFAWKYGLDSSSPDFARYWYPLLAVNVVGISLGAAVWLGWLTRGCRTCIKQRETYGEVLPEHEVQHVWRLWAIIAGFAVAIYGFAYFAEADAAWHQVVIRDTAFTPSHMVLFWGVVPLAVVLGAGIYLYAATRLPRIYARGVPLSLALFVTALFMLFVWVAFNEWGHSFWVAEELFSAPLHWGFVLFAFMALSLVGVVVQTITRIVEIASAEAQREGPGHAGPDGEGFAAAPAGLHGADRA